MKQEITWACVLIPGFGFVSVSIASSAVGLKKLCNHCRN